MQIRLWGKSNTVLPRIIARAIINFEGNFARKYFVNFWEYKYFGESSCFGRSVINDPPFRYKSLSQRVRKNIIYYFGGAIIRGNMVILYAKLHGSYSLSHNY